MSKVYYYKWMWSLSQLLWARGVFKWASPKRRGSRRCLWTRWKCVLLYRSSPSAVQPLSSSTRRLGLWCVFLFDSSSKELSTSLRGWMMCMLCMSVWALIPLLCVSAQGLHHTNVLDNIPTNDLMLNDAFIFCRWISVQPRHTASRLIPLFFQILSK